MGSSGENSAFGPVLNPRDRARVAGGSSGGSAAAVAAGIVPLALGTDTGGSVRQPAALCGVVGLKPGWGRVSRFGLVAFGSSLDQVGPISADVAGSALALRAMAGADPRDSTSDSWPVDDYAAALASRSGRIKVGVPRQFVQSLAPEPRAALDEALDRAGVTRVEVDLPHLEFAVAAYYVLASAEASSNLARFDGVRYGRRVQEADATLEQVYLDSRSQGLGEEVQRRIMLGTFALSAGYAEAYYGRAQAARRAISQDFRRAFERVDLVAGLTSPTTAWPLGEKLGDPIEMYLSDAFTIPASLAGLPAISIPAGFDSGGLPWGLQLMAPVRAEAALLRAARLFEARS
jgi:aspartyl-tRNA(Asn)/glutamyl-tRNA(Gln) amidotransferase subunit A